MKVSKTICIEDNVLSKAGDIAHRKGMTLNAFIQKTLWELIQREKVDMYTIVSCKKCGTEYSSKFDNCPACETSRIETAKENEKKQLVIDALVTTRAALIKDLSNMQYTCSRLKKENRNEEVERIEEAIKKIQAAITKIDNQMGDGVKLE